jgi:hypothetical protein
MSQRIILEMRDCNLKEKRARVRRTEYVARMGEKEEYILRSGGKTRRKEATRKTKT